MDFRSPNCQGMAMILLLQVKQRSQSTTCHQIPYGNHIMFVPLHPQLFFGPENLKKIRMGWKFVNKIKDIPLTH